MPSWKRAVRRTLFAACPSRIEIRQFALGVTLAIFISYNAVLDLGFGLAGSHGNSLVTGSLLAILPFAIFVLSFQPREFLSIADLIFASLIFTEVVSFIVNVRFYPPPGTIKEYLILISTLGAYVACRPISNDIIVAIRPYVERTMAIIVLIGAVFTVVAIPDQLNDTHGKPIVMGFDAAGLHFMGVLSILILGLVTVDRPSALRTALVTVLIFPPVAIFAAAMVRYTFIALAGSLLLALILTEAGKRRHIVAVGLTIFFAVIFGLGARYDMAKVHAAYLLEETLETGAAQNSLENMPSCNLAVNMNNSIAIRKALALDAVHLIPNAGLVGTGLDSFMKFSCIRALEVHNSILQMAVEFGWLGGALFVALIVVVIYQLLPFARGSGAARFVLCSLVLTVLLCLAHGRVSRDSALFAFLGCAAGMRGCLQSRPA